MTVGSELGVCELTIVMSFVPEGTTMLAVAGTVMRSRITTRTRTELISLRRSRERSPRSDRRFVPPTPSATRLYASSSTPTRTIDEPTFPSAIPPSPGTPESADAAAENPA